MSDQDAVNTMLWCMTGIGVLSGAIIYFWLRAWMSNEPHVTQLQLSERIKKQCQGEKSLEKQHQINFTRMRDLDKETIAAQIKSSIRPIYDAE